MGSLMMNLREMYDYLFYESIDPRVSNWFLMGSPWKIISITIFYIYFVKRLGPQLMKNRPAYNIDGLIRMYNLFQIAYCLVLIKKAHDIPCIFPEFCFCYPIDYSEEGIQEARATWYYFFLKLIDMLDTGSILFSLFIKNLVFFVLRKKNKQITFLHVYHHVLMVLSVWYASNSFAGGHSLFLGYINCWVHIVMYSYYFITNTWPQYRNNLWWKKYITLTQMVQFILIILHSLPLLMIHCDYPKMLVYFILTQNIIMLILFSNFYVNNYIKKKIK